MTHSDLITVEQFVAERDEFPDGGRWTELVAGRALVLEPPTIEHGTAVFNLGKALALHAQTAEAGYACFELGLIIGRNPDTLRIPAISVFVEGPMFAESDKVATENRPAIVVDIASTNDRRRGLEQRVVGWLDWGVKVVWVLDPEAKQVHAFEPGRAAQRLGEHQTLFGVSAWSGFKVNVGEIFRVPSWAR